MFDEHQTQKGFGTVHRRLEAGGRDACSDKVSPQTETEIAEVTVGVRLSHNQFVLEIHNRRQLALKGTGVQVREVN